MHSTFYLYGIRHMVKRGNLHHPIDRIAYNKAFVILVAEHWLEEK